MDSRQLVMVVDDEPTIAQFIHLMLDDAGYRTVVAHGGAEALAVVARQRPDLIVLDIRMPLMTGWHLLQQLASNGYGDIPVIATSADHLAGSDAGEHRICAYLEKPFMPDQLLALVEQCVGLPGNSTAAPV